MKFTIPSGRWHGHKVTTRQLNGLKLAEISYPPAFKTLKHAHEASLFYLVQKGSFTQTSGTKTREGRTSSVIYLRSDDPHADSFHNAGARCFVIEMGHDWLRQTRNQRYLLSSSATFEGGLPMWIASRIYDEYRNMDEMSALAIEGLAFELIAQTTRLKLRKEELKQPLWLTRAQEVIHAHFSESISVSGIAATVGVHPVHLARAFRQHYGCTVGEYLRKLRIDFARQQIMTTTIPLTRIAVTAGFYDQSHFTKTFKRLTGQVPSQYRINSRLVSR